jgi:hypothetical protein
VGWTFDSGTINSSITVVPQTTSPFFARQTLTVDPGVATVGTPAVEKIESVRFIINYIVAAAFESRNELQFGIDGPTFPFLTEDIGLKFKGAAVTSGSQTIDRTLTALELGGMRKPDPRQTFEHFTLTGATPEQWLAPKLLAEVKAFTHFTLTITRVQFIVTSTFVGVDPNDNDGSTREAALSGWTRDT